MNPLLKALGTMVVALIVAPLAPLGVAAGFGMIDHLLLVVFLTAAAFGLLYGLEAGILGAYDLRGPQVALLLVDLTWSLPNTVFGFLFGNILYIIFGVPSRSLSEDQAWIAFRSRGYSFGTEVLQTLGTVNLGGPGKHERVHVLQARILGPLFLPLQALNYSLNFLVQVLFSGTIGAILAAAGVREKAYFRPPASSAVAGFWGWIYYATLMELWAYGTED